ncbi:hypothetical protein PSYMO_34177, partial [Pseudomonas amygdali pv. mori str. 301020]
MMSPTRRQILYGIGAVALAILAFKCLPDVRQAMQMLNT